MLSTQKSLTHETLRQLFFPTQLPSSLTLQILDRFPRRHTHQQPIPRTHRLRAVSTIPTVPADSALSANPLPCQGSAYCRRQLSHHPPTISASSILLPPTDSIPTYRSHPSDPPLVFSKAHLLPRPRRPATVSNTKVHLLEPTPTSPTASRLPRLAPTKELSDPLFDLFLQAPDVLDPPQLPHKSYSRDLLPVPGEDSGPRHPGLFCLGFAPFKPP